MSPESPGIIVFPGAGSFGSELRPLLRELEPSAWLARYPGRFGRDFGKAAASFQKVVESCVTQVGRLQPYRPVLVGHSFGAYVAYATARELEDRGTEVSALVVAGATAPALLTVPEQACRSRSDTAAYLDGIDPGLLPDESDEWRDIVVDTAGEDLRVLREFTASAHPEVRCPVFAVRGEEDPLTSAGGIGAWAGVTAKGCIHREFPGGHSALLNSPEFAAWLREIRVRG
ncbi:alpha/beta fold hydrolase [Streptomyces sp. NBC_01142]|uniref:thioesterase II family protein n=1 Tax=Streptomyces sp. NBC_01142 TaxID=2975865 RepID=UPI00224D3108|nr:alpha/beta fold hydrolase [Streptomyces sp. NBC_01142]MCX4824768.1 alpha/beta fold hydrolase [Streptomyces sp. NBC_01142]MCX4827010.1 alpha/beta fold hydrolase [Streptomyces sp. NBC_01142]MCX4827052.1 alpha/beta fold hydrolase [Streptomyces sp. NBC_01142]